jgi:hypothetical protein
MKKCGECHECVLSERENSCGHVILFSNSFCGLEISMDTAPSTAGGPFIYPRCNAYCVIPPPPLHTDVNSLPTASATISTERYWCVLHGLTRGSVTPATAPPLTSRQLTQWSSCELWVVYALFRNSPKVHISGV